LKLNKINILNLN